MMRHHYGLTAAAVLAVCLLTGPAATAGLEDYVKRDDGAFAWELTDQREVGGGQVSRIRLTSQKWQDIVWQHRLDVYEPPDAKRRDAMLLFITGGGHESKPKPEDDLTGLALARACGAPVAVLHQVPNQPLLGGKTEDTLIAETFVRYLDTKDDTWPLLFPMVKSAVRAMDALQAWAKKSERPAVGTFVVSGASKRGWTTWLTGAVDSRVIAIAPMVIDTLNMKAQRAHSLEVWGKFSEQIDDYTSRGLTEKYDDPDGERLWKMVDPYTYRDRLMLPKLLINGTNDRYWTLDALNVYWGDLKGPKHVVYLPNAGHNLAVNRHYAVNGVGAIFRHAVGKRELPEVSWTHADDEDGDLLLHVQVKAAPKSAKVWVARSDTRDFRDSVWESALLVAREPTLRAEVARPSKGFVALFGDLEYEIDGLPFHLSTQIRQTGAKDPSAR
ncbi:MAG: PhoPQ-activated protein PqaA family protein [Isosphaeraceae bacterium]|nr:PhoPQ-activated protein PqaA family protein [Isosphaeraceae bacterium]